jgi:hypothetical protein
MKVQISDDALRFVTARDGVLYLRVRQSRCCSGAITYLDASTTAGNGRDRFLPLIGTPLDVQLSDPGLGLPLAVSVELRGKIRSRLVAFWDDCAYRL